MMEIFYEESSTLVAELRESLEEGSASGDCGQNFIQEMFRGVHTLKADATMMLFDGMAALSRTLEQLLYCIRNNYKEISDVNRFSKIFGEYLDYVKNELDCMYQGRSYNEPCDSLKDEIKKYLSDLTNDLKKSGVAVKEHVESKSGKAKQIYYIPSASGMPASESDKKIEENKKAFKSKDSKGVVLINQSDIDSLKECIDSYSDAVDAFSHRMENAIENMYFKEDTKHFSDIKEKLNHILNNMVNGDFTAVAKKMEVLVEEMSQHLNKPVKLLVQGADVRIDKRKRDKISNALIHMVRNAVDHGIEDMETREQLGKSPMGLIHLDITKKNGRVTITVEDDGAGIDRKAVIRSAYKNNMINDIAGDYSDQDIINFILKNGVSTTEEPNDYSGRGVGMDVINHQVKEMGGKLDISFEESFGTKVTIEI